MDLQLQDSSNMLPKGDGYFHSKCINIMSHIVPVLVPDWKPWWFLTGSIKHMFWENGLEGSHPPKKIKTWTHQRTALQERNSSQRPTSACLRKVDFLILNEIIASYKTAWFNINTWNSSNPTMGRQKKCLEIYDIWYIISLNPPCH